MIAAVAVGGTLAIASSASAIPVPIGTSTDTPYSGSGTPTSVYSLYNAASNGLLLAENLIFATHIDSTNFGTAFTSASQLSSTNVAQIASDFAVTASSNPSNFYKLDTAWCETPTAQGGAGQSSTVCTSNGGIPPTAITTEFTGTVQPAVAQAAANWPSLSQLVGFLSPITGSTLNSADSATVSSSGTVTSLTSPFAYDIKLSAPAGGYVLPSAFSLSFPAGLSVNTALVADEVNASTNTAAVELNPTGTSIGTVTLTSPLADEFGGSGGQLVGNIYVVQTGQSSGQGSVTQPYLELWFPAGGHPIYALGAFPGSLAFPLKLSFNGPAGAAGEVFVSLLNAWEPLPLSSLELNFPAATSPVKSSSCSSIPTVGATVTDAIAALALQFGDSSDGYDTSTGKTSEVALAASPTVVTNKCATVTKFKSTATGSASGLTSGHPTFTIRIKTAAAFGTVTLGLPGGLKFVKSKHLAKQVAASGARIKSVRIAGGRLVVTLKSKVKSVTIRTKRGAVSETKALIKSIKKHRTKKLVVRVKAGTTALKATIKA
ncbi:MAG: hypothetical protein KGL16_11450 [Acidobacteriota bacterium]|nr:hypothetical protein [Acidobacteriota bacterium]